MGEMLGIYCEYVGDKWLSCIGLTVPRSVHHLSNGNSYKYHPSLFITLTNTYDSGYQGYLAIPTHKCGRNVLLLLDSICECMWLLWKLELSAYQGYMDPDSKVHEVNMGPIWGRQDPNGLHVGPMNFAFWGDNSEHSSLMWTNIEGRLWLKFSILLQMPDIRTYVSLNSAIYGF